MNAYKCDICGKYFEDSQAKTGSIYGYEALATGHHTITLTLEGENSSAYGLFKGDICPDCMGYICVGLCEKGCNNDNVKLYAADHIQRVREEKEAEKSGEF